MSPRSAAHPDRLEPVEAILRSYPTLKAEDVRAALQYASELVREKIVALPGAV